MSDISTSKVLVDTVLTNVSLNLPDLNGTLPSICETDVDSSLTFIYHESTLFRTI